MGVSRPSHLRELAGYFSRETRGRSLSNPFRTALVCLANAGAYPIRAAKMRLIGLPNRRSLLLRGRFDLLDRAIDAAPSSGLWLEVGVWRGESINYIAQRANRPITGFDSFEGLPERWSPTLSAGAFSIHGKMPHAYPGVSLVKGWFDRTLPEFLRTRPEVPIAFLHVDCDLYSSTRTVLSHLTPRLTSGTVVVFDEFCAFGPDDEARAWREFCRSHCVTFRWLGWSRYGSVALQLISVARPGRQGMTPAVRP